MYLERLQRTLPEVRERIRRACERVGRSDADSVALVAVTKGHPAELLCLARDLGLGIIGESRVQEAKSKWEAVGDVGLEWHLIGHLQRNKVRQALRMFSLIQSVDSVRLAEAIEVEAAKRGGTASILVQVNASGEDTKSGFPVAQTLAGVREITGHQHLRVQGLMTMAPFTADESVLRETFRRAREAFELCREMVEGFDPRYLSMGMTNDYEIAVEEGSNMLRLGTALFGERVE